jgi:hypothetical protein
MSAEDRPDTRWLDTLGLIITKCSILMPMARTLEVVESQGLVAKPRKADDDPRGTDARWFEKLDIVLLGRIAEARYLRELEPFGSRFEIQDGEEALFKGTRHIWREPAEGVSPTRADPGCDLMAQRDARPGTPSCAWGSHRSSDLSPSGE